MNFYLSAHARDRMRERGVTIADIRAVIDQPDLTDPTPKRSLRLQRTLPSGRTLKVWLAASEDTQGLWVQSLDSRGRVIVKSVAWKGEPDD